MFLKKDVFKCLTLSLGMMSLQSQASGSIEVNDFPQMLQGYFNNVSKSGTNGCLESVVSNHMDIHADTLFLDFPEGDLSVMRYGARPGSTSGHYSTELLLQHSSYLAPREGWSAARVASRYAVCPDLEDCLVNVQVDESKNLIKVHSVSQVDPNIQRWEEWSAYRSLSGKIKVKKKQTKVIQFGYGYETFKSTCTWTKVE
jgi:hypothetical protein